MEDKTFEQKMLRLEEIVAKLEKGDVPIVISEGTGLAASCRSQLDQAEQQVVRLMKGADGAPIETEFTGEE